MKDKSNCSGCYNDFYNYNCGGECWSPKKARLVYRVKVGVNENPPYLNKKKEKLPDCWRGQRVVAIKPEAIGKDGYWKW